MYGLDWSFKVRKLAVSNFKGGVGKTTICLNLAYELARRGRRVLLVDLDPQGNLSSFVPAQSGGSIADEVGRGLTVADIFIPKVLGTVGTRAEDVVYRTAWDDVDIIPADIRLQDAVVPIVDGKRVVEFLLDDLGEGSYDAVIMDTRPDCADIKTQCAWVAADHVLVPVQDNGVMMDSLADTLDRIKDVYDRERLGVPDILVVHSLVGAGDTRIGRACSEALASSVPDGMLAETELRFSAKVVEASAARRAVGEYVRGSRRHEVRARMDYSDLADEVIEWMGV